MDLQEKQFGTDIQSFLSIPCIIKSEDLVLLYYRMTAIYQHLLETLKKTDTKHDLEWYASIFGTDAKLGVPEYEVKIKFILCSKIREFLVVQC